MFIVKNYLWENELEVMGRIVNVFFDIVENMVKCYILMIMEDWVKCIDKFIDVVDFLIL